LGDIWIERPDYYNSVTVLILWSFCDCSFVESSCQKVVPTLAFSWFLILFALWLCIWYALLKPIESSYRRQYLFSIALNQIRTRHVWLDTLTVLIGCTITSLSVKLRSSGLKILAVCAGIKHMVDLLTLTWLIQRVASIG